MVSQLHRGLVGLAILFLSAAPAQASEFRYEYKGNTKTQEDLTPAMRQSLFEAQRQFYDAQKRIMETAVLEKWIDSQAKAAKKDYAAMETELFKVDDPSEPEKKAWFEKNKARIPYEYEKIKGDIGRFMVGELRQKKRDELVAKAIKEGKAKYLSPEPQSPVVKINSDGHPTKGKGKVTIVEFADYQCPHCKEASEKLSKILKENKGKVKLVYMDFPVNRSGISRKIAEASHCADKQGKYWEFHYKAFKLQSSLTNDSPKAFAKELKLDMAKFDKCLASSLPKEIVGRSEKEARRLGVSGTPAVYVNGQLVIGHHGDEIETAVKKALK